MQFTPIVLALVSNKKKGALTQLGVPLKVKFVLGVIWTQSSNDLLSLKVTLWSSPPLKNRRNLKFMQA